MAAVYIWDASALSMDSHLTTSPATGRILAQVGARSSTADSPNARQSCGWYSAPAPIRELLEFQAHEPIHSRDRDTDSLTV